VVIFKILLNHLFCCGVCSFPFQDKPLDAPCFLLLSSTPGCVVPPCPGLLIFNPFRVKAAIVLPFILNNSDPQIENNWNLFRQTPFSYFGEGLGMGLFLRGAYCVCISNKTIGCALFSASFIYPGLRRSSLPGVIDI